MRQKDGIGFDVKRREFITVLGMAGVMPSAVRAQKGVPVIAIIGSGAAEAASSKMQMGQLMPACATLA